MKISRKLIEELTKQQVQALNTNSFFSSIAYARLWETLDGRTVWWVLEEDDRFLLLPGIEFGKSKLKRFQSMTDGTYANFVSSDSVLSKEKIKYLIEEISNFGYAKTEIIDFYHAIDYNNKYSQQELSTILVDISFEDWIPPDKKLQSEIRKANREPVVIEQFELDKHFELFLRLMNDTEKRHNRIQKYPDQFFYNLAKLSKTDNRVLWYWCEFEQEPVCSHINFIEKDMLINWQVYFDKKFSFLKANQKIIFDMVKKHRNENVKYLNLGGSPIDADTLIAYKLKWGGEIYNYKLFSHKNLVGKMF